MSVGFSGPHLHLLSKLWSIKSCVEIASHCVFFEDHEAKLSQKPLFIGDKEILSSFKAYIKLGLEQFDNPPAFTAASRVRSPVLEELLSLVAPLFHKCQELLYPLWKVSGKNTHS